MLTRLSITSRQFGVKLQHVDVSTVVHSHLCILSGSRSHNWSNRVYWVESPVTKDRQMGRPLHFHLAGEVVVPF